MSQSTHLHAIGSRARARNAQIDRAVAQVRERRRLRVGADRGHVGGDKQVEVVVDRHPPETLAIREPVRVGEWESGRGRLEKYLIFDQVAAPLQSGERNRWCFETLKHNHLN